MRACCTLLMFALLSCGDDDGGGGDAGADVVESGQRLAAVQSIANDVILPGYRDFVAATTALETAVTTLASEPSAENRTAAQEQWRQTMDLWQELEAMQVGPAGLADRTTAGEDLRDEIYSWPITNPCRVDQEIVSGDYMDVDAFASEVVNVRGLDAIEYLLFYEGETNACESLSAINRDGTWDAIADEIPARRLAYAATAATLLRRSAETLVARWDENFLVEITSAGTGSETFPSAQDALNALSDALFYVDKETKDMKVAEPGGLDDACAADCADLRESLYANHSITNVLNNVRGFQRVFEGSADGVGFDDLLVDVGQAELATAMSDAIANAITVVEAISDDVPTLLSGDPEALVPVHTAIRAITDLLKTQFLTALDLEAPMRAETDND